MARHPDVERLLAAARNAIVEFNANCRERGEFELASDPDAVELFALRALAAELYRRSEAELFAWPERQRTQSVLRAPGTPRTPR